MSCGGREGEKHEDRREAELCLVWKLIKKIKNHQKEQKIHTCTNYFKYLSPELSILYCEKAGSHPQGVTL